MKYEIKRREKVAKKIARFILPLIAFYIILHIEPASAATKHDELRAALELNQKPLGPVNPKKNPDADPDIGMSPEDTDFGAVVAKVIEIEKLIEAQKIPAAVTKIQELNLAHPYAIIPVDDDKFLPVWRYAKLRLSGLGGEAVKNYRAVYGQSAEKEFSPAAAKREKPELIKIVRKYPLTGASTQALLLLAEIELAQGRGAVASYYALEAAADSDLPPEKIALLATALAVSGDSLTLSRLWAALVKDFNDETFESNGAKQNLAKYVQALFEKVPPKPERPPALVPGILIWKNNANDENQRDAFRRAGIKLTSKYAVVAGGNKLYVQTETFLKAYDKLSGNLLWKEDIPNLAGFYGYYSSIFSPALSDNQVFLTHQTYTARAQQQAKVITKLRILSDLDASRKTIWEGTTDYPDNPRDQELFVSPPISGGGAILIYSENGLRGGNRYLNCYSLDSNVPQWCTIVASVWTGQQNNNIPRTNMAPPVIAGCFAICCSEKGVISAVNIATGELMWVTRYESVKDNLPARLETPRGVLEQNVMTMAPVIDGTTAYVIPADSQYIYAIDTRTGKIIWMRSRKNNGVLTGYFLLGAEQGRVYVAGAAVECLDGTNGKTVWLSDKLDTPPTGRPLMTKDKILCPVESGIAYFDLATGKLSQSFLWQEWKRDFPQFSLQESGNLLIEDGRIYIMQNNLLAAFESTDIEKNIIARLLKEPQNAVLHLRHAIVQIQLGRIDESLRTAERAVSLAGENPDDELKMYLSRYYLIFADWMERTGNYKKMAQVLDAAIQKNYFDNQQSFKFVMRCAVALDRGGDTKLALEKLHAIIEKYPRETYETSDGTAMTVGRYAAILIGEIIRKSGALAYEEYEAKAALMKDAAKFPNSAYAAKERIKIIEDAINAGNYMTAEWEITSVEKLCPQFPADEIGLMSTKLFLARAEPVKNIAALKWLWKVKPGNARTQIFKAGNYFFVCDGRSLVIIDPANGKKFRNKIGFLGVGFSQADVPSPDGKKRTGLQFDQIHEGFAADKAGVKTGDILLAFDGNEINQTYELLQYCMTTEAGREIDLKILRDGKEMTLKCVVGDRAQDNKDINKNVVQEHVSLSESISFLGLNGKIAFAELNQILLQFNVETGEIVSRKMIESFGAAYQRMFRDFGEYDRLPGSNKGVMVVVTQTRKAIAFNPQGERLWEADLQGENIYTATYKDGLAAFIVSVQGGVKNKLLVYDIFSGKLILGEELQGAGGGAKIVIENGLVLASDRNFTHCFDLFTKKSLWKTQLRPQPIMPQNLLVDGRAIINLGAEIKVVSKAGREMYKIVPHGQPLATAANTELIFCLTTAGVNSEITAYDIKTGKPVWQKALNWRVSAQIPQNVMMIKQGKLILGVTGDKGGKLVVVQASDGKIISELELAKGDEYNSIFTGEMTNGVIGVTTDTGTVGVSAVGE